ncbi:hypothetical protein K239x_39100 [Planctomycetes bacterium K23_9]|uniref:Uncharacterized protein n=1 Tax=Stieleria marina TaxID=1930275 RepID=A0A517NXQ3_9BACT|nr:hypothetical protein K239x_39100 [Planctomycetes bacterium K23_9]
MNERFSKQQLKPIPVTIGQEKETGLQSGQRSLIPFDHLTHFIFRPDPSAFAGRFSCRFR